MYGLEEDGYNEEARIITAKYDRFYLINVYSSYAEGKLENLEKNAFGITKYTLI